jgi:hypothetical protein
MQVYKAKGRYSCHSNGVASSHFVWEAVTQQFKVKDECSR